MPAYRFDDLRHTWVTPALPVGMHPKVVSGRLGCATTGITLEISSHLQPGLDAQAATKFAQPFSAGG